MREQAPSDASMSASLHLQMLLTRPRQNNGVCVVKNRIPLWRVFYHSYYFKQFILKKITLSSLMLFLLAANLIAQSVGINNSTPNSSAILDVMSNTKGMLIPRTSSASRNAIVKPAKGLILYDTTTSSFWFHNGTVWAQLSVVNNSWNLTGNAATKPAVNFMGTTDNQPLRFRVNNLWAGEIHPASGNLFLGLGAGNATTSGTKNTAIGEHSLFANSSGSNNTANGYYALSSNTSGPDNTANGYNSLFSNTIGSLNTASGYVSLFSNDTGSNNTAYGAYALYSNTTGNSNTASGANALGSNSIGDFNTATGEGALLTNTTGSENTATGVKSLYLNSTGNNNTANGGFALKSNTTGDNNTAMGRNALLGNTTGVSNTAIGNEALLSNTIAISNTAGGYRALRYTTIGSYNTANGVYALSDNIDGESNTAYGGGALTKNTSGNNNTAVGTNALNNNVGGNYNIAIGFQSGTGGINSPNLSNTIGIGNSYGFLNGASNQAIIGDANMYFIGGKVNWGVVSDARIKNTIMEDVKGLDFILRLRPVTYHISNKAITAVTGTKETPDYPGKYDGEKVKYSGFLAQEVEKAAKASGYDFSGYDVPKTPTSLYTLKYAEFVVPLVKAMQEQQVIITNQQEQIDLLKKRLSALETKL